MRLIAHRGAPQKFQENTLASFEAALSNGAKYIEFDVHITQDNHLIVYHNDSIVVKQGRRFVEHQISRCTYEHIQSLPLEFDVPTLEQVLALTAGRCVAYTEIKSKDQRVVRMTLDIANRTGAQIVLSSFHHYHLIISKSIDPTVPTMALLDWNSPYPKRLLDNKLIDEIGVSNKFLTPWKIARFIHFGLPVCVYTVNSVSRMNALKRRGIDAVFTDTF